MTVILKSYTAPPTVIVYQDLELESLPLTKTADKIGTVYNEYVFSESALDHDDRDYNYLKAKCYGVGRGLMCGLATTAVCGWVPGSASWIWGSVYSMPNAVIAGKVLTGISAGVTAIASGVSAYLYETEELNEKKELL